MKPDIGLIADAALIALHENAKRVERVALRMPPFGTPFLWAR